MKCSHEELVFPAAFSQKVSGNPRPWPSLLVREHEVARSPQTHQLDPRLRSMDGALGPLKTLLPAAFLILSPFSEGRNLPLTSRLGKVPRAHTPCPSHREPLSTVPSTCQNWAWLGRGGNVEYTGDKGPGHSPEAGLSGCIPRTWRCGGR